MSPTLTNPQPAASTSTTGTTTSQPTPPSPSPLPCDNCPAAAMGDFRACVKCRKNPNK